MFGSSDFPHTLFGRPCWNPPPRTVRCSMAPSYSAEHNEGDVQGGENELGK